jgi:hypothetical protein
VPNNPIFQVSHLYRPLAQALSDDDFNEALNLLQVRNLKYWVIWHIADILITIPLNQNILIIKPL